MKNGLLIGHQQIMFICALLISGISGALFSLLLSFAAIKLKSDQTITGTALNMFAPAIFLTVCLVFFSQEKLVMPDIPKYVITMQNPTGTILDVFINKVYISTYIIILLYIVLSIWLYKSKIGTHLRACGEHPQPDPPGRRQAADQEAAGGCGGDRRQRAGADGAARAGQGNRRRAAGGADARADGREAHRADARQPAGQRRATHAAGQRNQGLRGEAGWKGRVQRA